MQKVTLGRTGITVNKNGFGALPIQRTEKGEAVKILQKAYENGIDFYDTARAYSDSEEKLGAALSHVRDKIFISTKTQAKTGDQLVIDLETSLRTLKTDYVDILQLHNPPFCPVAGHESGLYEAALKAKNKGKIRFIGFTNHRLAIAKEAIECGLYDTMQFPLSYLADPQDIAIAEACKANNIGFLAMKALSGGLITNARAAYAFLAEYDNVLPLWGIQHEEELDEFISFQAAPPAMDDEIKALIEADKNQLGGDFCRGCGYCTPCPVGIQIDFCARMSLLLRRAPSSNWLTPQWQANMAVIEECLHCGQCTERCPYSLDTPSLLERNYEDYKTFIQR